MTNGLSYSLIQSAAAGDTTAIEKIVAIYEPYINTLASRTLFDADGNKFIGIDVDLQEHLKSKLIDVILRFKVA